jgi:antitoxin VapB
MEARKVSLFRNGRSQALRIPKEFELPAKEALIRMEGGMLIVEPVVQKRSLLDVLETLRPCEELLAGLTEDNASREGSAA